MFQNCDNEEGDAEHLKGFFCGGGENVVDVFFSKCVHKCTANKLKPQRATDKEAAGKDEAIACVAVQIQNELQKRQADRSNEEDSWNDPREEKDAVCSKMFLKRKNQAFVKAGCFVERQQAEQ